MANFQPKSYQQIVADMAAKLASETPLTDFTSGSVALTLIETAAQEDFQQYVQMLQVILGYNLDTTEGEDLDLRAAEYGLTRFQATPHSGFVSIKDLRFTKISTKIYAGKPGPTTGSTTIFVDDASSLPSSGAIYIGRGTSNTEGPIAYSSAPVDQTSYWQITLDTALTKDHGTDETIILAQFGIRTVSAGNEVQIPENDFTEAVTFEINQTVQLLDGEDVISNVLVTALQPGGFSVPANSIISFVNSPFTGASVNNPLPFVNGRDIESDQALRDRIRDTVQSLSRGTGLSVRNGIIGLIDSEANSSIVSAKVVPPVILTDGPTKVFIDNGRGLEPSLSSNGLETLSTQATGGEKFFQLQNFPLVKANVVSQNIEPFSLSGGETIVFKVGTDEETFTFAAADFEIPGSAEAIEVSQAINSRANIFEARTITDDDGSKVILTPIARENENIQVDSSSSAQAALNFSELEVFTLKLYKNDKLLVKDGRTASLISDAQPFDFSTSIVTTTDGDITVTSGSKIVSKSAAGTNKFQQLVHPGDYIKMDGDSDLFYIKVRTIVSDTKFILAEAYPANGGGTGDIVVWNSPQLDVAANGDEDETEIVSFSPSDFANPAQVLASEVIARLEADLNLSRAELAVNDTRVKIISDLENSEDSKLRIMGGYAGLALGFNSSSSITGSLIYVGGSKKVEGVGTSFLTDVAIGQWIKAGSDDNGSWTKVEAIESNSILYLTEGYRGQDHNPGVASFKLSFGTEDVGQNRDYVLNRSNGQIELTEPLVAGDSLTAGSNNTRAFTDSRPDTFDFSTLGASSTLIIKIDDGIQATATSGAGSSQFTSPDLVGYAPNLFVGFYIECTSGNNAGQTDLIVGYNNSTGQINVQMGFSSSILPGDKFALSQIVTFINALDFADPQNATAAEVAAAINAELLGGRSEVKADDSVRIRTSNFLSYGKVQVVGGTAASLLQFSSVQETNQESNLAFVVSDNSDRNGLTTHAGFTLSPNQNLAMILDGDSANKTFSIPLKISGTVTTGGSLAFSDSNLPTNYSTNDYFNDFWIYWISGANEGSLQVVTDYVGATGSFTASTVFNILAPTAFQAIVAGDEYALVPRTAENIQTLFNDLNTTTLAIVADTETLGVSGDFVQISTKTAGSSGKVFATGGTGNSFGITVESVVAGSPVNDLTVNSKAGLAKGMPLRLTVDGEVSVPDNSAPFNTFESAELISALASNYFDGLEIEFLTGLNAGVKTTVLSYTPGTGAIVLADSMSNPIATGATFRISKTAFLSDIQSTTAPYTLSFVDQSNTAIDVAGYVPVRSAAVRDLNGLSLSTTQVEGIDGYKNYTGLIQLAQWTIDGLDRDQTNYPGLGAAGTQFEVIPPVNKSIKLIVDITPQEGVSLSSISGDVANAISQYINSLQVGDDVILSEIVAAAQSVVGVFDVTITNISENITIADGELARITDRKLIIG